MHTKFWLEALKGRDYSEDVDIGMDLREMGLEGVLWIGFIWLRTGTGGGPLWTR